MSVIVHDPNDPKCRCDECQHERDEQLNDLVERSSIKSLADLYRKGRQSGLLSPRRSYH